jgi:CBS domain-containing protein
MTEEHVGALVVVTRDSPPKVVGVLTDRDMALDVLGRSPSAADLRAGDLAKHPPVAVPGSASLGEAVEAMEKAGVRRLLVIDEDGGVIGLVSADDIVCAMADDLQTLARALRHNIQRETAERKVFTSPAGVRPVFASYGTIAIQ